MGEAVTIRLRGSWEKYPLIPVRSAARDFFPPYKEKFTLKLEDKEYMTYVSGQRSDRYAERGDPEAGTYLRASIPDIAREYPEISGRDELTIEKESENEYRIVDW